MFLMMRYISGLRSFQRVWSSRSKRHLLQGGGVIAIPMSQSPRVSSTGSSTSLILFRGDAMNRAQFNHFFLRNPRAAKQVVGQVDTGYFSPSDIDQMTTPSQKDQSSDDDFWKMVFGSGGQSSKDLKDSDFNPWGFDYSGQGQTQQKTTATTKQTTKQQAPIPGLTQQQPASAPATSTSKGSGWLKWGLLSALAATGVWAATSLSEEPKKTTRRKRRKKKRKYRKRGKRR